MLTIISKNLPGTPCHAFQAAPPCRTGFADLPQDCMLNIMNRLGPRDLANFSGSCRALRVLSRQAVPGLHLTLYPHQVRALVAV